MDLRKRKGILENIRINTLKKPRKCLMTGCDKDAIQSHLLQKNGVINRIAEQKHIFENVLDPFEKFSFKFKRVGVNEAFTYPAFCNSHDSKLFQPIEGEGEIFDSYESHLLLSLRPLMVERRKKEIGIDFSERILKSELLKPLGPKTEKMLQVSIYGDMLAIADQKTAEHMILENLLALHEEQFSFEQISLPNLPICCSSCFTYETTAELNMLRIRGIPLVLNSIYFHLVPLDGVTKIVIGCSNASKYACWNYIEEFINSDERTLFKKISDLLINQVENWICSPTFYNSNIARRESRINELIRERMYNTNQWAQLDFNLFEI